MRLGWKVVAPRLLRLLTGQFASAMVLFPFVLLRHADHKEDKALLRHEQIHLYQQAELLLLLFYVLYAAEYGVGRLRGKTHLEAYRDISFEQEARYHEENLGIKRRWFGWVRYVIGSNNK